MSHKFLTDHYQPPYWWSLSSCHMNQRIFSINKYWSSKIYSIKMIIQLLQHEQDNIKKLEIQTQSQRWTINVVSKCSSLLQLPLVRKLKYIFFKKIDFSFAHKKTSKSCIHMANESFFFSLQPLLPKIAQNFISILWILLSNILC